MHIELIALGTRRGPRREEPNPITGALETRTPLVLDETELAAARAVFNRFGGAIDERAVSDAAEVILDD